MTSQRLTGIVCTVITSIVIAHYSLIGNFDAFTWFCAGILWVFVSSIIWESGTLKVAQILTLYCIGGVLQFHGEASAYIGVGIIAITTNHCFGYGFLTTHTAIKAIIGGILLAALLFLSTYGTVISTFLRLCLTATFMIMAWIPGWAQVRKVTKTLEKTIIAGVVLVEEIKHKEAEHESEG